MTQSIHPAASQGFAQAADLYQNVRPSYPAALAAYLEACFADHPKPTTVDLGAGTGKFLPMLLPISQRVTAIEPIAEMLEQLQQQFPKVETILGTSNALALHDQSIDAIFCAQSFHWFSHHATLNEFARVLKPNGQVFLIWNQRDIAVDWVNALADLIAPLEADTPRYHSGQWQQVWHERSDFELIEHSIFDFQHMGTVRGVVCKRLLSTSFIAAMSKPQQQQLHDQFAEIMLNMTGKTLDDLIAFPYHCHVYRYQYQKR